MPSENDQLQRARDLILQKQFDQARLILLDIAHNETAQKWLVRLEEIAPTAPPRVKPESPIQPLGSYTSHAAESPPAGYPHPMTAPASSTVTVALNLTAIRYAVAATAGIMAVLMIASFFLAPWMDLTQISFFGMDFGAMSGEFEVDEGPLKITAMELWMGRNNGENFVVDFENPTGSFADVRFVDRLLILIPVGAIVLAWFAWLSASGEMNGPVAVGVMAMIALLLLIAPFTWESMSNQQIEDDFRASMEMEGGEDMGFDFGAMFGGMFNIWQDTYSTSEQKILGGLALLACLAGFGAEVMQASNASARRV